MTCQYKVCYYRHTCPCMLLSDKDVSLKPVITLLLLRFISIHGIQGVRTQSWDAGSSECVWTGTTSRPLSVSTGTMSRRVSVWTGTMSRPVSVCGLGQCPAQCASRRRYIPQIGMMDRTICSLPRACEQLPNT